MVRIEGLRKAYKQFRVLNGLNMSVKRGEVYGFIGENGAGKTTTMNIICNVIEKDAGSLVLNGGQPLRIGYLPESPSLYTYMNGREYLTYIAASCKYAGSVRTRNEELLGMVGLDAAAKRRIKGYSRGMVQRLGLAAAMYNDPDLAVFDEPTSALDPQGRADVIRIIQSLKSAGKTVVLSTHILSDVERVADTIGILHGGVLVEQDSIEGLFARYEERAVLFVPSAPSEETHAKLMSIDFADVRPYAGGIYDIRFEDTARDNMKLLEFLAQNRIAPARYEIRRPTLETIYMKAVGRR